MIFKVFTVFCQIVLNFEMFSEVESSYDGPSFDTGVTLDFMKQMIETFKKGNRLHRKYAYMVRMRHFSADFLHLELF